MYAVFHRSRGKPMHHRGSPIGIGPKRPPLCSRTAICTPPSFVVRSWMVKICLLPYQPPPQLDHYRQHRTTANLRTTIQGVVSGLHYGLGFGLGAILGGFLYSGLGARLCFRAAAMLPSLSLLVLALPTLWGWFTTGKRLLGSDAVSYAPAPDAV